MEHNIEEDAVKNYSLNFVLVKVMQLHLFNELNKFLHL